MKKALLITLIVAAALVVTGASVAVAGLALAKFDFSNMSTETMVENTFEFTEEFSDIKISDTSCEVNIVKSSDGVCRVYEKRRESEKHEIGVEDGTLVIKGRKDPVSFGFVFAISEITVYLPERDYMKLEADTSSGDINCDVPFSFSTLKLSAESGRISLDGAEAESVSLGTSSGKIVCKDLKCAGKLEAKTSSGSLTLENVTAGGIGASSLSGSVGINGTHADGNVAVSTSSGSVTLSAFTARDELKITAESGSVTLDGCDAGSLDISTSSGSVNGRLLSEKIFVTSSGSVNVHVPDTTSGGICRVKTGSGSIRFTVG